MHVIEMSHHWSFTISFYSNNVTHMLLLPDVEYVRYAINRPPIVEGYVFTKRAMTKLEFEAMSPADMQIEMLNDVPREFILNRERNPYIEKRQYLKDANTCCNSICKTDINMESADVKVVKETFPKSDDDKRILWPTVEKYVPVSALSLYTLSYLTMFPFVVCVSSSRPLSVLNPFVNQGAMIILCYAFGLGVAYERQYDFKRYTDMILLRDAHRNAHTLIIGLFLAMPWYIYHAFGIETVMGPAWCFPYVFPLAIMSFKSGAIVTNLSRLQNVNVTKWAFFAMITHGIFQTIIEIASFARYKRIPYNVFNPAVFVAGQLPTILIATVCYSFAGGYNIDSQDDGLSVEELKERRKDIGEELMALQKPHVKITLDEFRRALIWLPVTGIVALCAFMGLVTVRSQAWNVVAPIYNKLLQGNTVDPQVSILDGIMGLGSLVLVGVLYALYNCIIPKCENATGTTIIPLISAIAAMFVCMASDVMFAYIILFKRILLVTTWPMFLPNILGTFVLIMNYSRIFASEKIIIINRLYVVCMYAVIYAMLISVVTYDMIEVLLEN